MTENKRFSIDNESDIIEFDWNTNEYVDDFMWGDGKDWDRVCNRLNELYEEKEWLEMNNKDLVSFIKSKGYTLKDFLKYVGQFGSVGVNKEDWND